MKFSKTIFITGGAGYIGSHAVKLFLEKGFKVIVFDNLSRGYRQPLTILKNKYSVGDNLKFIKGDLRNKNEIIRVFRNNKIDVVIHFAALCSVNESMEQPELYFENNIGGSMNLFESMRVSGVRDIIFSSTCAVYGETRYLPVDERHPTNPTNPYGESKLAVEKILYWYGVAHNFKYTILRYFNVCGADKNGIIGDSKKPSQLLMQNVVRGAMNIEPFKYTCSKVNTFDGTPIRDYVDVEDLANAHYLSYRYLQAGRANNIFNLGNGAGYSVKQIVSEVERQFHVKISEGRGKVRKGEYEKIYADPRRAAKLLRWKPKKGLQDSITSLKKWYSNFPFGYKK